MGKIFVTPVSATADSLMPNFETAERRRIGERRFAVLLNMSAQLALQDPVKESADFRFVAGRLQFYPAVAQVPDKPGDVETFRDVTDRPAKADPLDVTLVKDLHGCVHASKD